MKRIRRILKFGTFTFLALAFSLTSCKKKQDVVEPDPDLTTEKEVSNADADMNSIINDVDLAMGQVNFREEGSASFTVTSFKDTVVGTFDGYILITYTGDGGDGLSRSGKIIVYLKKGHTRANGNYEDSSVFSGTKVDGRFIEGFKWTKQISADNASTWKFQIMASGKIANENGTLLNYTSTRTRIRSFKNGASPSLLDSWIISGTWEGTNSKAQSVTASISTPIIIDGTCSFRLPVSGKIDFSNVSLGFTRSIDYGSGGCDNIATFTTAKGKEFQFYIR